MTAKVIRVVKSRLRSNNLPDLVAQADRLGIEKPNRSLNTTVDENTRAPDDSTTAYRAQGRPLLQVDANGNVIIVERRVVRGRLRLPPARRRQRFTLGLTRAGHCGG